MNLTYKQQLIIAMAQSIIAKYGAILDDKALGDVFGLSSQTIKNKLTNGDNDMPKYTQLKGKRVVMANDLAEFMVKNESKF